MSSPQEPFLEKSLDSSDNLKKDETDAAGVREREVGGYLGYGQETDSVYSNDAAIRKLNAEEDHHDIKYRTLG